MDITAHAKLYTYVLLLDALLERRVDVDDMSKPIRPPGQQCIELAVRSRFCNLREMHSNLHTCCFYPGEGIRIEANDPFCGVATEIHAYYALASILERKVDDLLCFNYGISSVYGENQECPHGAALAIIVFT